ncbi:MAG TPA: PH domain-containing protein [Phycisphaerae bacterium]|nr:PH domain-containing protein [Phycisphaerae bacterium]
MENSDQLTVFEFLPQRLLFSLCLYQSAESVLKSLLDRDERLLWSGQPRTGIQLRPQDAVLIPFSLLWGGFAIFWEYMVLTKMKDPTDAFFPIFGAVFVLIGLYLIFGRFFVDARIRERTFYGVTSERVIIISGLFSQQVKSLQLSTITDLSFTQRPDESGTITFGPTLPGGRFVVSGWPASGRYLPPSFDLIDKVKDVYDIIRNAQRSKQ